MPDHHPTCPKFVDPIDQDAPCWCPKGWPKSTPLFDDLPAAPESPQEPRPAVGPASAPPEEKRRLSEAAVRVLGLLKVRGRTGALNYEICQPDVGGLAGLRRLRELRAAGYPIAKAHEDRGVWRYTLKEAV